MTIPSLFAAVATALTHRVDVPAAVAKLDQVNAGLQTVSAVLALLPDSPTKTEASAALHRAAAVAAQAVVLAHTVEATVEGTVQATLPGMGASAGGMNGAAAQAV